MIYQINEELLRISEGITTIPNACFARNNNFKEVFVPEGVVEIGYDAFRFCEKLSSIHFPSSLKIINHNAFNGCPALHQIVLPDQLEMIGAYAFKDCKSLNSIIIPDSVKMIYGGAFQGSGLVSITIGNSVSRIEPDTFRDCLFLTEVDYPPGIHISFEALRGTKNLSLLDWKKPFTIF